MKSAYDEAVRLLPSKTAAALGERFKTAEEFRLRAGRYPCALIGGREEAIADRAVTRDDIACVLEKATNASLHAVWQDMSKGFTPPAALVRNRISAPIFFIRRTGSTTSCIG